jgi:hypothetical protein
MVGSRNFPRDVRQERFLPSQSKACKSAPICNLVDYSEIRGTLLEGMAGTTGLEPAASAVIVPSGTLHIANLHVDSEFVIVAEVNDVVAAVAGASRTPQALSMDRKQKRSPAN